MPSMEQLMGDDLVQVKIITPMELNKSSAKLITTAEYQE